MHPLNGRLYELVLIHMAYVYLYPLVMVNVLRFARGPADVSASVSVGTSDPSVLPGPVKPVLNVSGKHVEDYGVQMRIALATQ